MRQEQHSPLSPRPSSISAGSFAPMDSRPTCAKPSPLLKPPESSALPACTICSLRCRLRCARTAKNGSDFRACSNSFGTPRKSIRDQSPEKTEGDRIRNRATEARDRRCSAVKPNPTFPPKGTQRAVYGASAQQRLRTVDLSEVAAGDLPALEEISNRLLRRMMKRLSRRLAISARGLRVDLRRSLRRSIAHGGDLIALAWKASKRAREQLRHPHRYQRIHEFLQPVPGAIRVCTANAAFRGCRHFFLAPAWFPSAICFARAVCRRPSAASRSAQPAGRVEQRSANPCTSFNRAYGRVLTRDTVLMIVSDGWETGDPQVLADQMRSARRRVFKSSG